jgi:hypothetical protein
MTLTPLIVDGSRPVRPVAALDWRRGLRDAALASVGRTSLYCPSLRSLASLVSGTSET